MANASENCPNRGDNKRQCTCPSTGCARHGLCCQCVIYHREKGQLPQCFVKAGS